MNPFEVHDIYSLLGMLALIGFQIWQIRESRAIKRQTNGLVAHTIEAVSQTAHLEGEKIGVLREQAARLEEAKASSATHTGSDQLPLTATIVARLDEASPKQEP